MKRIVLSVIIMLISSVPAMSQWVTQHFYHPHESVFLLGSTSTIFSCGEKGIINKSTDAGLTWTNVGSLPPIDLHTIFFSGTTGFVGGDDGLIYRTTDNGNSWADVSITSIHPIKSIRVFNDVVYAVNADDLYKSTNNGNNWTVSTPRPGYILTSMDFFNSSTGWVGDGVGAIFRTTNGGDVWEKRLGDTLNDVIDIRAISVNVLYASFLSGKLLKSPNGGFSWEILDPEAESLINDIFAIGGFIFTAGNDGEIGKSLNSGTNWTTSIIDENVDYSDIGFTSSSLITAFSPDGKVIQSSDLGANWTELQPGGYGGITGITMKSATTGYACDNTGNIFKTTNGAAWNNIKNFEDVICEDIYFVNNFSGVVLTEDRTGRGNYINNLMKTNDGGQNWSSTEIPYPGYAKDAAFANVTHIYVIMDPGATDSPAQSLVKTTNGGLTWDQVAVPSGIINSIYFNSISLGYIVGESGNIYKTTDRGVTWTSQTSGVTSSLYSVWFDNSNTGYACGHDGVVLKTTNGGTNWNLLNTGTTERLYDVEFGSTLMGCAVGENGTRIITNDGGQTWFSEDSQVNVTLNTVSFIPNSVSPYIGGNMGFISGRDAITGVNFSGNELPAKYTLEQNYPNPFNPSTTIRFTLPQITDVSLAIYDASGRMIRELINSQLNAGNHKVSFDADGLSSGVYFYKLESNEFSQTRRMVLIK